MSDSDGADESNRLGGEDEVPNPLGLTDEWALRMYAKILKRSGGKGIVCNKDGDRIGKIAPNEYKAPYPELIFDQPDGYIALSRSFLVEGNPEQAKVKERIEAACVGELVALGIKHDASTRYDMFAFHNGVMKAVRNNLRSKLNVVLNAAIANQKIKNEQTNMMCKEKADVVRKYHHDNPQPEDFKKMYYAFVQPFEDGSEIDAAIYNMMNELKLWYASGDSYKLLTYTKEDSTRIKLSSFRTLGRSIVRQFRHSFTQGKKLPHGVCFTITVKGRPSNERRKTQQFDFTCVKNWNGEKHRQYCRARGLPAPQPLGSNVTAVW